MSSHQNEYGFLNNIDAKIVVFTTLLATALTIMPFVLNAMAKKDCRTHDMVYCGDQPRAGEGPTH